MAEGFLPLCREQNFTHVSDFVFFAPLHARLMISEFIRKCSEPESYTPSVPTDNETHMAMLRNVQAKGRIRTLLGRAKQTESSSVSMTEQMKGYWWFSLRLII